MQGPATLLTILPGLRQLIVRFWPYLRGQRPLMIGSLAALLAEVGLRLLEPWPLKFLFDWVFVGRGQPAVGGADQTGTVLLIGGLALWLVTTVGLRALAAYWSTIGFALIGNRVLTVIRGELYSHIQRLPLAFHTKARNGDLVVRVTSDVGLLQEVAVTALLPLIGNVLILVGMLAVMFWLHWQLTLLALVVLPLFWLTTLRFGRRIQEAARVQRQREGALAATAAESLSAIKIVQALSLEEIFARAFRRHNQASLAEGVKGKRLAASLERTVDVLIAVATALVLWYGAWLVLRQQLTPGDLLVFLSYLKSAFRPIQDMAKYTGRLAKATAAGERIIDLLDQEPSVRDYLGARPAPILNGPITFERVGFAYHAEQPILKAINLTVRPGQRVAVVGPSGHGKSTLTSLLLRLYDPTAGRILINGQDIRSYTLASLRSQIGVVLQDNLLFAASVRDNIAYGAPDVQPAAIERAAKLANADSFVQAMPQGYETVLGERGVTLSSGQRQRLAIARAAVRNAPILILDEPTTGLDEENQRLVLDALNRLAAGRTTFWVTHDLDHAAGADLILYLEDGHILEQGTPAELMEANGRYAALYRLQALTRTIEVREEPVYAGVR